jgi:isocitrate dehydrogenase
MSNKIIENFNWLDQTEEERVKRIALDQTVAIDPINEIETDRVKRIALNKAANTDPINAAFNLIRDQTIKKAYYIDSVQQIQNFINTQFNESLTFIDYFLIFIFIVLLIYFIYKNLNSRKDYI